MYFRDRHEVQGVVPALAHDGRRKDKASMPNDKADNPWTTLSVTDRLEDPFIRIEEHAVVNAAGEPGGYGVVRFKKRGVGIVPIDEQGRTLLVGQWRYPLGRYLWEIPEGGHDPAEAPLDAARRELREEIAFVANSWREILSMDMSTALTDERVTCFLAWNLRMDRPDPDPQEVLAVRRLSFADAIELVWRGEIRDALSIAALLKVQLMATRDELPAGLAALLPPR
jgi:8-oxo-dGTP pyrophosphatase MutT (NUDIX family)